MLGLLPTVLSLAGTSTIESGLLALRRPLLALLVGVGSTSVFPMRTNEYKDPVEMLRARKGEYKLQPRRSAVWERTIVGMEYLFAVLAIANLAQCSYVLGTRAVCSFSFETAYAPMLWAFLAIPCHVFGAIAVFLRVKIEEENVVSRKQPFFSRLRAELHRRLRMEFQVSSSQPRATLGLRVESNWFLFISWFTSTGIVLHIILGTLVLGSTLFISALDADQVVAQFLASTLVCRAILTYELRGMRRVVKPAKEEEEQAERFELLRSKGNEEDMGMEYRELRPMHHSTI